MSRQVPPDIAGRLPAALHLFLDQGLDGTRVDAIVAATGIPKATLYYHFDSKEAIFAFLLRELLDELAEAVDAAKRGPGAARERLVAVIEAIVGAMAANPTSCLVLLSNLSRAGRMPEIAGSVQAAFHAPVEELLVEGSRDGSLRATGPATASAVFGAVVLVSLHHLIMTGDIPVRATVDSVGSLLLHGLATGGAVGTDG